MNGKYNSMYNTKYANSLKYEVTCCRETRRKGGGAEHLD